MFCPQKPINANQENKSLQVIKREQNTKNIVQSHYKESMQDRKNSEISPLQNVKLHQLGMVAWKFCLILRKKTIIHMHKE